MWNFFCSEVTLGIMFIARKIRDDAETEMNLKFSSREILHNYANFCDYFDIDYHHFHYERVGFSGISHFFEK